MENSQLDSDQKLFSGREVTLRKDEPDEAMITWAQSVGVKALRVVDDETGKSYEAWPNNERQAA